MFMLYLYTRHDGIVRLYSVCPSICCIHSEQEVKAPHGGPFPG